VNLLPAHLLSISPAWTSRAATAAWLSALTLMLAACGGGGGEGAAVPPPTGRAQALSLSSPGQITAFVQQRLLERERLQARHPSLPRDFGGLTPLPVALGAPAERLPLGGTVLQEAGVDEADLIKSDGRYIWALHAAGPRAQVTLLARRADGPDAASSAAGQVLHEDDELDAEQGGLVLTPGGASLAVVTRVRSQGDGPEACIGGCPRLPGDEPRTAVQKVHLAEPLSPRTGTRIELEGRLLATRRLGQRLVVVTEHHPLLPWERTGAEMPTAQREAAILGLRAADLLPRKRVNGGAPQPLVTETECWLQPDNATLAVAFTTVTVFDLESPDLAHGSRCFAGGTEAVYVAPSRLVLASTRWALWPALANGRFPPQMETDLHLFALDAGDLPQWRGSGSVPGHLGWDPQRKAGRMSWHDGHLRVLSFTGEQGWARPADAGSTAPSPATLTVLRAAPDGGSTLQTVARLPNAARPAAIGKPGEQVHAVRFVGTRGYVVTFRQVDPLYVLDLADPADPRTVGELEVPGFSDHLFALSERLLLGVGRDVDAQGEVGGLQLSLFDVSDPGQPQALARLVLGRAGSLGTLDFSRHGLNWLKVGETARVTLPVALTQAPWGPWTQSLQRLEVDLRAGRLTLRAPLLARAVDFPEGLATERSLQIGDWVYHLHEGTVSRHAWDEGP
jgi:hypothetical protein